MSKHSDGEDAMAELFGLIVIAIIGLFVGAVVAENQKKKNIVRLPETLEPLPPELPPVAQEGPVTVFVMGALTGFIFMVGVGMVASPTTLVASLFVFLFSAFLGYLTVGAWDAYQKAPKTAPPPPPPKPEALNLPQTRVYTVSLPRGSAWQPERAYRFMEQILHKLGGRATFQIVATQGRITWKILDLRAGVEPSIIMQAVGAFYPDAEVEVNPFITEPYVAPFYRYVLRFKQAADFVGPIRYVSELKELDPLVAITQEMNSLGPGEQIVYTLFLSTFADFAYKEGEKLVTAPNIHPLQFMSIQGWIDAGVKSASGKDKVEKYVPADQKVFQEKLNNPLYQGVFTIQVDAPTAERVADLSHLDSHVWQFVNQPYNALAWHPEPWPQSIGYVDSPQAAWTTSTFGLLEAWLTNSNKSWQEHRLILEPRELASLWHLPHGEFTAPGIVWSHGKQVQLPQAMRGNQDGIYLGTNHYGGQEETVYLPDENRAHHMAVIGMTGTGKSTFLHHLIYQDILDNRGLAVIDPHGSLVQNILQTQIPSWREADLVVLDLANEDYPPPLNLLAVPKGIEHGNAAGQLMAVLDKVYGGFQDKPRMADTLWSALVTLWQENNPTVRDVPRLFDDIVYRHSLIERLDNIVAEEFWDKFEKQSEQQQEQLSYPVAYRMRAFYGNPTLYPVMCHPGPLDFARLMRENKIILVSLKMDEKRVPPLAQQLLGAVLVSQLQMAAMEQTHTTPFYLYIDEAQHFVTTALDEMLSEARKQGLSLTLANQYLSQLAGNTLDAVMGNVGAMIAFQCGHEDARVLTPYMQPGFDAQDLINLDLHRAAAKVRFGKQTQPAFSLITRKPLEKPKDAQAREARLRQLSIQAYTPQSKVEVLKWLAARYPKPRAQTPPPVTVDPHLYDEN